MTKEKIIDRLQKLQAKASSAAELGNEAEALAFAEKVQELLMRHKLDMSVLSIKQQDDEEPLGETWVETRGKQKRSNWIVRLADAVCVAYFCRNLVGRNTDAIFIIGRKTDRQIAEFVLLRLINFIEAEGKRQHGALRYRLWKEGGDMSEAHGFLASFRLGAVRRISQRLKDLRKAEAAQGGSMALVIVKSDVEVEALAKEHTTFTVSATLIGGGNRAGYQAGDAAGERADISGSGLSSGDKAARLNR